MTFDEDAACQHILWTNERRGMVLIVDSPEWNGSDK
jgi:hypothetical protein